jgi:hypothetical protein
MKIKRRIIENESNPDFTKWRRYKNVKIEEIFAPVVVMMFSYFFAIIIPRNGI